MKKYFSKVRGRIILLALTTLLVSGSDILRPIIEANLVTSITQLNYVSATWFSIFYILYAINNIVFNLLNNKIRDDHIKSYEEKIQQLREIRGF